MATGRLEWRIGNSHNASNIQDIGVLIVPGQIGMIYDIRFSPKEDLIATAGEDGVIKILDLRGKLLANLEDHNSRITQLSWSPDGLYLASSSADGTIRIWDIVKINS